MLEGNTLAAVTVAVIGIFASELVDIVVVVVVVEAVVLVSERFHVVLVLVDVVVEEFYFVLLTFSFSTFYQMMVKSSHSFVFVHYDNHFDVVFVVFLLQDYVQYVRYRT